MTVTHKRQIEFISYIQRLLKEGDFTSTYKFAFLHALADICIEQKLGLNDARLKVSLSDIAERIISLYWQHSQPFFAKKVGNEFVLLQNHGKQAKLVSELQTLRQLGIKNFSQAKSSSHWHQLYLTTIKTLKDGPLWRLQILSKEEDCFLYPHIKNRNYIELNSGIAHCFRLFHDIVITLARLGWINKISNIASNQKVIGRSGELNDFLFGSSRNSLLPAKNVLMEIQKNLCFYCKKPLRESPEVDHFIPFSQYSNDLGHNFVLTHKICNHNKRDYLAAPEHRSNWEEQNLVKHEKTIVTSLSSFYECNAERSILIADWAYNMAYRNGNKFWLKATDIFVS
ncbi:HNH endonuclease [Alteromonas facilis]|uniref:HNH endonuclease signature motif containing protein n=1 Tax=Alteromonas facilis TaxID=2048004 RepID=UPI000C28F046|nr:HNH endonuclease [Alteromonas facilis]